MSTEVGSQKKTKSCQHSLRMTPKGNKENVPFDSSIVYISFKIYFSNLNLIYRDPTFSKQAL